MSRIIFHIDFDYFYAQIEEVLHPEYKKKPIVVCMYSGRTENSGAVASCNYIARKLGVRAAMPIIFAKKILDKKDALFVPAHREVYEEKSREAMTLLEKYADAFEIASIDEAFLDVSKRVSSYEEAKTLALEIKEAIRKLLLLTCSIGIGPNKLIAKIASDFQKPDGLTVVKPDEVATFLAYLEVDKIPGIGPKGKEALLSHSIRTISDLARADPALLIQLFGKKTGVWLMNAAKGEDTAEVKQVEEQKQISRIVTLKKDSTMLAEFKNEINHLVNEISIELITRSLTTHSVGILAIDDSMHTLSKSRVLPHPTNSADEIKRVIYELFDLLLTEKPHLLRRVGVKVERLEKQEGQKKLGEF